MIGDGETIFLDATSTAFALAHRLQEEPAEDLTIVTTSPAIALGLEAGAARVIMAPGEVDLRMRAVADGWTVDFLRRISVDAAYVSGSGFDLEHGLTTGRRPLADVLAAVRDAADRVIALLDASKLGRSAMVTMMAGLVGRHPGRRPRRRPRPRGGISRRGSGRRRGPGASLTLGYAASPAGSRTISCSTHSPVICRVATLSRFHALITAMASTSAASCVSS